MDLLGSTFGRYYVDETALLLVAAAAELSDAALLSFAELLVERLITEVFSVVVMAEEAAEEVLVCISDAATALE